jgi:sigma-B regulation protein RsbU (phosphoserine phosphatase)
MTIIEQEWLIQMQDILEMLNEGVGISDDTGRILFVNQCMERLLGAPRSTLIGKTADAFYSGADYEFTLARMAQIKDIGFGRYEFFVRRADGTRVPVIISGRELTGADGSLFLVFTCTDISQQKRAELGLREANVQLGARMEQIDRDLAIASRVQESLAPQPLRWGGVAVETFFRPVHTIGGDFGLVFPFDGKHLDLIVCDISGHGIGSALLANHIYTETISLLRHGMELDEMLRNLNHFVIQYMQISGFIFTMAAARLDLSRRQLIYAAAGHPPALLISSTGSVRRIGPLSTVLGQLVEAVPGKALEEFKFSAGDRLMLYTDGLTEVWNENEEILGVEGLEKIVRKAATASLHDMRAAIIEDVNSYSARPLHDDITLILAEIR